MHSFPKKTSTQSHCFRVQSSDQQQPQKQKKTEAMNDAVWQRVILFFDASPFSTLRSIIRRCIFLTPTKQKKTQPTTMRSHALRSNTNATSRKKKKRPFCTCYPNNNNNKNQLRLEEWFVLSKTAEFEANKMKCKKPAGDHIHPLKEQTHIYMQILQNEYKLLWIKH